MNSTGPVPQWFAGVRTLLGVFGTRSRLAAAALAVGLAASACSSSDASSDDGAAPTTTAALADGLVTTADGGSVDLDALAGQDVMLWFWAPW